MGKRIIKSVLRATKILDYIGSNDNDVRLTEISKALDINKSTLHSIISTLEQADYIRQNKDTRRYSLGNRVFELGKVYEGDMPLTKIARPFLETLAEEFDETVQLGVLSEGKVLYIDTVESSHTLRMTCTTGETSKLHCSATGKVLLAYCKQNCLTKVLDEKLESYTPNTISDKSKLKEELEKIKRQGYAFDKEEAEVGLNCVAVPVKDHTDKVVATIGISAPVSRVSEEKLVEIKDRAVEIAKELSAVLGYRDKIKDDKDDE